MSPLSLPSIGGHFPSPPFSLPFVPPCSLRNLTQSKFTPVSRPLFLPFLYFTLLVSLHFPLSYSVFHFPLHWYIFANYFFSSTSSRPLFFPVAYCYVFSSLLHSSSNPQTNSVPPHSRPLHSIYLPSSITQANPERGVRPDQGSRVESKIQPQINRLSW